MVQQKLLKQLCHEHGIFSAGNTDCYAVARLYKLIILHCLDKSAPDRLSEFLADALFHFLAVILCFLLLNGI